MAQKSRLRAVTKYNRTDKGGFKDSVDLLQNAINYLRGHEK